MSIVLQDVFLFSDSIYNNITLYSKTITKEEVVAAAKKIGAHDFIMKLPGDYNYDVKERGAMLSVGQRQLISFVSVDTISRQSSVGSQIHSTSTVVHICLFQHGSPSSPYSSMFMQIL